MEVCKNFSSTLVLFKTNHNKFIGLYSPDTWVQTPPEKKDFTNANKTIQFYYSDQDLKIIKDKDDKIPGMTSDETFFLGFVGGI